MTQSATATKPTTSPRPLSAHTEKELDTLVANYRRKGATADPRYGEIVAELHRRGAGGFDLVTTLRLLHRAAAEGRCVSYGEVAAANGKTWTQAYRVINRHLWAIVEFAQRAGWPMLSAMIVNAKTVDEGHMDDRALRGFARAAHDLGHHFVHDGEFQKSERERCMAWGAEPLDESILPTS